MQPEQRVVTRLPLSELWDASGTLAITRQRPVGPQQVAELLRDGTVRFVVADCGHPLQWIAPADGFRFWKEDVKPHLVTVDATAFPLDGFPGGFCFVGSEWGAQEAGSVVVLERHH